MGEIYLAEVRDFKNDPTKSGRVKVRIYNHQNDEQEVKDEDLPWAMVIHPVTSAATAKIGVSPSGLKVGSRVLVTFFPTDHAQQYPIIIGSAARGDKPEGQQKSNGGIGKDSQEAQKNSGGKVSVAGPDNPASDGDSSDKAFKKEGKTKKTYFHNQKVLDQKKPDTEKPKYADAPFVDADEGKGITDVRQKMAKNADKPTSASGQIGEKDLPSIIKQVDPKNIAQVIPQIYQKMSQMRGILSFGGGMGAGGGGSGGAGTGATGTPGAGTAFVLQDSFTGALAILVKKYGFEKVIALFVATLEGTKINDIDVAYRKYVTNAMANLIKLALYFGPLNIPVSKYDDTIFGDLVPTNVVTADAVPDMYVKQYYTLSNDPYPGYQEWVSPDKTQKVYVRKEAGSYHFVSSAQEVFSTSETAIAAALDPYLNPQQDPPMSLTATKLNVILKDQMYQIENNTANNNMGNNSNNGGGGNSGNMLGGILQQLMQAITSEQLPKSVLDQGEIQKVIEKNTKTMGMNNQLFEIAKGALSGGNPLSSLGNMGGLSNILGGFMQGGGGLGGVLNGAGFGGGLLGGFGGFGGSSGGGGGGAGSGFGSSSGGGSYSGGNISAEGMKNIEQMLKLLGVQ